MPPTTPNNSEIDQALKEYETKSGEAHPTVPGVITPKTNQPPTKQVEGVSFDTDKEVDSYKAIKIYNETATPKMVKAVIKYSKGAVKDQRQAEWILLSFVIIAVGISVYLIFFTGTKPPTITPEMKLMSPKK
jgi:hypothetical protein